MTWKASFFKPGSSWLPQVVGACNRTVERIGRHYHLYRTAGTAVVHYVRILTGETLRFREALEEVNRLLRMGWLTYEDGKICHRFSRQCVDSYDFFKSIEDFYDNYREMRRSIRDVELFCVKEKPTFCRAEVDGYLKSVEELWKIPVNPKKALRDIRLLAIMRDPKLREALEKYSRFAYSRRRLIRCASGIMP